MIPYNNKSTLHHFINEPNEAFGSPKFVALTKGKDWIINRGGVNFAIPPRPPLIKGGVGGLGRGKG
jgi:hypothetical protein